MPNGYYLKMDILGCWRTSETTARLIVITKFLEGLNIENLQTYPSIVSSDLNASINTVNLLSSINKEYSVIDEDGSYFVDEDDSIVQSSNDSLEYKYELLLDIDSTVETRHIVLELNDGVKSIKKIVRISGINEHSDNIYFYKQEAYDTIYDESEGPIYDENGDEIIGEMGTGGYVCEAIEFIESDYIVGFQKGGRVYAKEFIEKDGVIIANGMKFTQFIEKVNTVNVNVVTMADGSVLTDIDGAIIRTL